MAHMHRNQFLAIVGVITVITFGLISHLLFLRQDYFMDEGIILDNVLHFLTERTIEPDNGLYPTFFSYVSTPLIAIYVVIYSAISGLSPEEATAYLILTNKLSLVILPRILSLIFLILTTITVTIFLMHRLGKFPGVITGLLILSSPAFLQYGSFALPDSGVLLFSTVSFIFCIKASENREKIEVFTRYVMLSAFFCGLATATKYNAAATVFPLGALLIARVFDRNNSGHRFFILPFLAAFVCLIAFVVATPSWIVATQTMVNGINYQFVLAKRGHPAMAGVPILGNLVQMLTNSPVLFIGAAFSILNYRNIPKNYYLLCITLIVGTLLLSTRTSNQAVRYLFPLYPAVFVIFACGLTWLVAKFGQPTRILAYVICISVSTYTFIKSSDYLRDSNVDLAREWIYRNLPENTKLALDWAYVPQLYSENTLRNNWLLVKYPRVARLVRKAHKPYDLETINRHQENWIYQTDVDYIVTSSKAYNRYFNRGKFTNVVPAESSELGVNFRERKFFYESLFSNEIFGSTVEFSSGSGPSILIFKRAK